MSARHDLNPIFVHASPRSGSTYFFNVLRRNQSLMCFNEAIIDVFSHYGKADISRFRAAQKWNVNHAFLDRDDFAEFVEAWDEVMHLYPPFLSFQDYLPPNGILPSAIRDYLAALMQYARSRAKRPALCEIHSRGRAGALRAAFGGFHVAQYRDPLSQFGSFIRPVIEGGEWGHLTFPLMEMGICGEHPLYRLVPEPYRVPILPWPADDRAQRWSSATQYMALAASTSPNSLERLLRWHLFAWALSNFAALCHSDFAMDIDRVHDEPEYRGATAAVIASECGAAADFGDVARFSRYYEFEGTDIAAICDQVAAALISTSKNGRLGEAALSLGAQPPVMAAQSALDLLLTKLEESKARMLASADRRQMSAEEWRAVITKNRVLWFNPSVRNVVQRVYPFVAPMARIARRLKAWP